MNDPGFPDETRQDGDARFRSLVLLSNDWFWEQDEAYRYTRVESRPGHPPPPHKLVGKHRWDFAFDNMTEAEWDLHKRTLDQRQSFRDLELSWRDATGRPVVICVSGEPVFRSDGRFAGYRGTARDVTGARSSERKAHRIGALYATLSEANHAIIHAQTAEALYWEICGLAVHYGHFAFARIIALDAPTGMLLPVAHAGQDPGSMIGLRLSVDPAHAEGNSAAAVCVRTGLRVVINDVLADQSLARWHARLRASGVRSSAVLPLKQNGAVVATMLLYSQQLDFFDGELIALLDKLALNISFALDNFAREDARREAEAALRASQTRFRDFAEAAAEFIWELDLDGRFTFISSQSETISGYPAQTLIGRRPQEFMAPGEAERVKAWLKANRRPDGSFRELEYQVISSSGETRYVRLNGMSMLDENGQRVGSRGTGTDITDRRAADERIHYLATRDPLTELPNRMRLNDRLVQAVAGAHRAQRPLAVLFIDLDHFKHVNDTLGHEIGDLVLKSVAKRLASCVREVDTLTRLGGDEFVMVLDELRQPEDAAQVAAKILAVLAQPFAQSGHTFSVSCSIGISLYPYDAPDVRALLRNADIAMYYAKTQGRSSYQFFSPDMNERAVERLNLETALRNALERDELLMHYQAQLDIRTGSIVGVEALLRWHHPQLGLLPPAKFVGVAEESGLIEPIGEWALLTACRQAREWELGGLPAIRMAINISARQLRKPAEFVQHVLSAIRQTGVDPARIELEMTESLLQNTEENIAALKELGARGVRIAVDDFGTGYSSLSYLRQLPIHTLKIDRSFIVNLPSDREGAAIVQAIVAMGHSLGLRVTAEGVETREQLAALRKMRCDEYQGFLFRPPLDPEETAALLRLQAAGEARSTRRRAG